MTRKISIDKAEELIKNGESILSVIKKVDKADAAFLTLKYIDNFKCCRCESSEGTEDHTCPYAEEINDDHESLCNCCADCTSQCADDI